MNLTCKQARALAAQAFADATKSPSIPAYTKAVNAYKKAMCYKDADKAQCQSWIDIAIAERSVLAKAKKTA